MGAQLPAPIPQLAKHLDYRSHFLLEEAQQAAVGLTGMTLLADPGNLPRPVYETVEYFGMLKHYVHLKRYTDFVLRLNPFLIQLQLVMLENRLAPQGLKPDDLLSMKNGRRMIRPQKIGNVLPGMLAHLNRRFGGQIQERDISIPALNVMLQSLGADAATLNLLKSCEKLNSRFRNPAAHSLFSVTDDDIQKTSGRDAESLVRDLENTLLTTLGKYDRRELETRINIYDPCDKRIRECL